jgi:thiosulfate/3-mercaptopyruvate sulfurtransferase
MRRSVTLHRIVLVVALASAAVGEPGPARATGRYANPHLLAETDEVARALDAGNARIVDLRGGMAGHIAYRAGHLPGAAYLDVAALDDPAANAEGFPIRPAAAAALFGRLGIDQETPVIAYDDSGGMLAARLFFVLEYYGHAHVRVMNGGLAKWRREGRPLAITAPAIAPRRFEPRPRRELVATAPEVRASLGRADACLIDARTAAEFTAADRGAERGGHIPGAANIDWTSTLRADGTFKDADALRALFDAAGLARDRTVVVYCTGGLRSSQHYLALRLLGHSRIRNYDGSWMEWSATPALPVAK